MQSIRQLVKSFLGAGFGLALLAWLPAVVAQTGASGAPLSSAPPSGAPPNIVLIVADDIGFSDFGSYGGEIETPHIDALAQAGIRFTNFHVASSCAPTRAMLMTGTDSHLAGIGSMRELMPLSHRGRPGYGGVLNDRVQTIAQRLQSAGYRTSAAGKWHLGIEARNLPPARGFDFSVIQADSGSDNFEMRPYLPMQAEAYWFENGERLRSLSQGFYSSTHFVDKTIEFLRSSSSQRKPFFAYVAFMANHTPIQAPAHFIDRYRGRYLEGWVAVRKARIQKLRESGLFGEHATLAPGLAQSDWDALSDKQQYFEARRMQAYAGMATAMDHEIGRLIAYLRETQQYANTVFVVLSDNGAVANEPYENEHGRRWLEKHYHREVETLGAKGSWVSAGRHWGRVSNTPFSGQKFFAGEGGVRVPLIISGLPSVAPGTLAHEFTHVTDIVPTLLEIAGVNSQQLSSGVESNTNQAQEAILGKSLLPALTAVRNVSVHDQGEAIGFEFSGNSALYQGDFKLIRNQPPLGDRKWRLFNIHNDPGETTDLREHLPDRYQDMLGEYAAYANRVRVLSMPEDYSLGKQVAINALIFVFLPRYLPHLVVFVALLLGVYLFWRSRRVPPGSQIT